ncbi:MAG: hypothetical protein J6C53_02325 [Clostridia bacterium]|nr:hypothetical protein [Clostridia bacterium]
MALFGKKKEKKQDELEEEIEITEISVEGKDKKVAIAEATEEELNYAIGEAGAILKNNRDLYKKAKAGAKHALIFTCIGVGMAALNYVTGNQATILAVGGFGLAGFGIAKTISSKKKREKVEKSNLEARATEKASYAELEAREKVKVEEQKAKEEEERAKRVTTRKNPSAQEDLVLVENEKKEDVVTQNEPQEEVEAEA